MKDSYWQRVLQGRVSRRRFLQTSSSLGAGAALLAACGGGDGDGSSGVVTKAADSTKDAVRGGTLGYFANADPENFDPYAGRAATIRNINMPVYQRLLKWKAGPSNNVPQTFDGDAAESFEISGDGLQITFKMRQGNKWEPRPPLNSRLMTTDDVKFSWDAFAAGNNSTKLDMVNSATPAAPVERLEFPDKNTVVAKLAFIDSSILTRFAFTWNLSILPVEADGGRNGFNRRTENHGSGPYMITKAQGSIGYEFQRNPNYWYKERPFLDGFTWPVIPESAQVQAQLKAGRIWYLTPSADQVLALKKDVPQLNVYSISPFTARLGGYHVNPSKQANSPFKDVRIRRAMSMLIDRDAYNETFGNIPAMRTQGIPMESGWDTHVPVGWPGDWLDPKANKLGEVSKYLHFNKEEAVKLLRAANFYGTEFVYSYIGSGGVSTDAYRKNNEVIMAMLAGDGALRPKPNLVEAPVYSRSHNNSQGQFEGTAYNPTSGAPDLVSYIFSEFMPGGSHNYGSSPEFYGKAHDIGLQVRKELDLAKRHSLIHEWQIAMADQMPTIPVQSDNQWTRLTLAWPKLRNYQAVAVNSTDAIYSVLYENYWYDKSKDT